MGTYVLDRRRREKSNHKDTADESDRSIDAQVVILEVHVVHTRAPEFVSSCIVRKPN